MTFPSSISLFHYTIRKIEHTGQFNFQRGHYKKYVSPSWFNPLGGVDVTHIISNGKGIK